MSVYKGENVIAGGSVDTYFVRKPVWSQAVAISAADLVAGYEAPADGMIVGSVIPSSNVGWAQVLCNDIPISVGMNNGTWATYIQPSTTVNKGDVITINLTAGNFDPRVKFVPFEDSTTAEPEVVTPEYIRNQNILSDWEAATIGATAGAATTMQYDGFIIIKKGNTTLSIAYVNGVDIAYVNNVAGTSVCATIPVRKGDTVYVTNQQSADFIKARYYKLRDYRGR